jgi:hypothetical protein
MCNAQMAKLIANLAGMCFNCTGRRDISEYCHIGQGVWLGQVLYLLNNSSNQMPNWCSFIVIFIILSLLLCGTLKEHHHL